jgi:hypothetical protein
MVHASIFEKKKKNDFVTKHDFFLLKWNITKLKYLWQIIA